MRCETAAQLGQAASPDRLVAVISSDPSSVDVTLPRASPAGIKDDNGKLRLMLLVPFTKQNEPTRKHHQF